MALEKQLRFLCKVHHLEHLVLIAHQGCAFYSHHLSVGQHRLEAEQLADLSLATDVVLRIKKELHVHCFFGRRVEKTMRFELVSTTAK